MQADVSPPAIPLGHKSYYGRPSVAMVASPPACLPFPDGASARTLAWHRRRLVLADGDVLTWIVIDTPAPPRLEAFRLASVGAIHHGRAVAILVEHGHPDAGLRVPDDGATLGRFH